MKGIIWYKDEKYGSSKLNGLIEEYDEKGIECTELKCDITGNATAYFANGDEWQMLRAVESHRMARCNVSLIERSISPYFVSNIIKYCTMAMPFQAFNYYGDYDDLDRIKEYL